MFVQMSWISFYYSRIKRDGQGGTVAIKVKSNKHFDNFGAKINLTFKKICSK